MASLTWRLWYQKCDSVCSLKWLSSSWGLQEPLSKGQGRRSPLNIQKNGERPEVMVSPREFPTVGPGGGGGSGWGNCCFFTLAPHNDFWKPTLKRVLSPVANCLDSALEKSINSSLTRWLWPEIPKNEALEWWLVGTEEGGDKKTDWGGDRR